MVVDAGVSDLVGRSYLLCQHGPECSRNDHLVGVISRVSHFESGALRTNWDMRCGCPISGW